MSEGIPEIPRWRVTREPTANGSVVAVGGELDLATVEEFSAALRGALAEGPVTLDLRGLAFMDSSGIRALDEILRESGREGWSLAVHSELQPPVRQLLELTGMLDVLPFESEQP